MFEDLIKRSIKNATPENAKQSVFKISGGQYNGKTFTASKLRSLGLPRTLTGYALMCRVGESFQESVNGKQVRITKIS